MVKTFYVVALLLAVEGGMVRAQTNATAAPQSSVERTVISSRRGFYSNATRQVIYTGGVSVTDPKLQLTCEQLTADFPKSGGHINRMVALTNVVMDSVDDKGETNHATSDMAVYEYNVEDGVTNEIVTLSGNARAENAQLILYGEPITYNRATGNLTAEKEHMIIKQKTPDPLTGTNAPAPKTNSPSGMNGLPISKTNFPPGTIQNIDRMIIPSQP
jgi:lipopolysaccharide transport protein LptA